MAAVLAVVAGGGLLRPLAPVLKVSAVHPHEHHFAAALRAPRRRRRASAP
jgi:hypothetical protein